MESNGQFLIFILFDLSTAFNTADHFPLQERSSSLGLSGITLLLYLFIHSFIYLFLAVLGLRCCARAFSSCGKRGLLFVAVRGLLIAVASLVVVVEHRF